MCNRMKRVTILSAGVLLLCGCGALEISKVQFLFPPPSDRQVVVSCVPTQKLLQVHGDMAMTNEGRVRDTSEFSPVIVLAGKSATYEVPGLYEVYVKKYDLDPSAPYTFWLRRERGSAKYTIVQIRDAKGNILNK